MHNWNMFQKYFHQSVIFLQWKPIYEKHFKCDCRTISYALPLQENIINLVKVIIYMDSQNTNVMVPISFTQKSLFNNITLPVILLMNMLAWETWIMQMDLDLGKGQRRAKESQLAKQGWMLSTCILTIYIHKNAVIILAKLYDYVTKPDLLEPEFHFESLKVLPWNATESITQKLLKKLCSEYGRVFYMMYTHDLDKCAAKRAMGKTQGPKGNFERDVWA